MSTDAASALELLQKAAQLIAADPNALQSAPDVRSDIVKTASQLVAVTQNPMEHFMGFLTNLAQVTVIRLFIKWGVFENIPSEGSISFQKLSEIVGADLGLLTRLGRMLVATGVLKQVGDNEVALTPQAMVYVPPHPLSALLQFAYDFHAATATVMPKYFEEFGLKEPVGQNKSITAYAMGDVNKTIWEHLNADPKGMAIFMQSMVTMSHMQPTVGSYKFDWAVEEAAKSPERKVVVDVGGGHGHAVASIGKAVPALPLERCIVQDLPEIVEEAKKTAQGDLAKAGFMAMDLHKEQPIKGALIYYIRRCLHDYGDAEVVNFLKITSGAMAADSRLLIVEQIIGNPPSPFGIASDVFILTIGGKERSAEDFQALASQAGLKVNEIFYTPGSDVGVVEIVKA